MVKDLLRAGEQGLPLQYGAVPIISGPLVVGNSWHGWQAPVPDCNTRYIYLRANVSFQYIDTADDGSLYFVVSFSDIMPDATWCVQQGLYSVFYDAAVPSPGFMRAFTGNT